MIVDTRPVGWERMKAIYLTPLTTSEVVKCARNTLIESYNTELKVSSKKREQRRKT